MKKNSARMLLCAGLCAAAVIGTGLISYAASSSDSAAAQTAGCRRRKMGA
nr:hypothetical protein [Enterocloster clostridioformis]